MQTRREWRAEQPQLFTADYTMIVDLRLGAVGKLVFDLEILLISQFLVLTLA
jgi:hypothetical protein